MSKWLDGQWTVEEIDYIRLEFAESGHTRSEENDY
jgi:hypothetical protein